MFMLGCFTLLARKEKRDMKKLEGFQKMHLRALAHSLKPVVMIGQKGLTEELIQSAHQAIQRHELIKIKFVGLKDKEQKEEISQSFQAETGSELVSAVGHVYAFYRQQDDPEKRRIRLPQKSAAE
jgi:RNA-binding protein